jgi:hypothetical protein
LAFVTIALPGASAVGCRTYSIVNKVLNVASTIVSSMVKSLDEESQGKASSKGDALDETMDEDQSFSQQAKRKPRGKGKNKPEKKKSSNLALVVQGMVDSIELWGTRNEEHTLTTMAELLWTSICLCHIISDLNGIEGLVRSAVERFSSLTAFSLIASHRYVVITYVDLNIYINPVLFLISLYLLFFYFRAILPLLSFNVSGKLLMHIRPYQCYI